MLAGLACDEAQGFYLSRPMTATALAGWMRDYVKSGTAPSVRMSSSEGLDA